MRSNTIIWSSIIRLFAVFVTLLSVSTALLTSKNYEVSSELIPGVSLIKDKGLIPNMHAGHIPLTSSLEEPSDKSTNYFFWKFQHQIAESRNLIIWLNGGPGCSSMDGALFEIGPFRVDSLGRVYPNEGSWHSRGDLLFVDQPVGTGFSTSSDKTKPLDDDLELIASNFLQFLENYYKIFPADKTKDLILAGESYAGQYIPFIAKAIKDRNSGEKNEFNIINLKSLIIGNAWIDPKTQSLSYLPFAIEKGLIDKKNPNFTNLLKAHERCQNKINSIGNDVEPFLYPECDMILKLLLDYTKDTSPGTPSNRVCTNIYDINLKDSYPACGANWPVDINYVPKFFSTPGVLEALNLDPEQVPRWTECNNKVLDRLTNPVAKPSINLLPNLLESGLEILLFNGENDLVCNNKGVLDSINKMTWNGVEGFSDQSQYYDWKYNNMETSIEQNAGYIHYDRNLTFISVYNASHMVSYDKALIGRGVLDIYLDNVLLVEGDNGTPDVLVTTNEMTFNDIKDEELDNDKSNKEANEIDEGTKISDNGDNRKDQNEDNDDDNDNNDRSSEEFPTNKKAKLALLGLLSLAIIGGICLFFLRGRLSPLRRTILVDSNNRTSSHKKTVSWADNDSFNFDLENDQLPDENNTKIRTKDKKGYTSVPNDDIYKSFELEEL